MSNDQAPTEKPCLISSGQGFSVLYKQKYLYSRYNPSSAIEKLVAQTDIPDNTLVLFFSPLLGYGLSELVNKVGNSFVLVLERDRILYDFSLPFLQKLQATTPPASNKFASFLIEDENSFVEILYNGSLMPALSNFRRCIVIEGSGGCRLYDSFYKNIVTLAQDAINNFWRNRITLVKMGRLFARNLLRNLPKLLLSQPLEKNSIARPILVAGAGPSLDIVLPQLKNEGDLFYIIAVDAALVPLLKAGIIPDAVLALESQLANEKAFIGAINTGIPIIADLTSRPHILSLTGGNCCFVLSRYEETGFLRKIERLSLAPESIPALGSVGLAAIEIALLLRLDASTAVFFTGLDFSYTPGKTHCREAPIHRYFLQTSDRLNSLENPASAYRPHSHFVKSKRQTIVATDPALQSYGQLLCARYSSRPNLYDVSILGISTGCQSISFEHMMELAKLNTPHTAQAQLKKTPAINKKSFAELRAFYNDEQGALKRIRSILTEGNGTQEEIDQLLVDREYLYLHFPDAHKADSSNISFLKRLRSELDFFLKDIQQAQNQLSEIEKNFQ